MQERLPGLIMTVIPIGGFIILILSDWYVKYQNKRKTHLIRYDWLEHKCKSQGITNLRCLESDHEIPLYDRAWEGWYIPFQWEDIAKLAKVFNLEPEGFLLAHKLR